MAQNFLSDIKLGDNIYIRLGDATNGDLQVLHDGTNSTISNQTGDLQIINHSDDKDIAFYSDDGSGSITEYFRVDGSGVLTFFSKPIQIADNQKIFAGDAGDLQIYHDGANSVIADKGTGHLLLTAPSFRLRNDAQTEEIITADEDGAVKLYYDGSKRIETTSAGVTVTGDVTISANTPELLFADTDNNTDAKLLANNGNVGIFSDINQEYSDSIIYFNIDGTERARFDGSGYHFRPGVDSTYDLGLNATRWRNVYADNYYGDGSNLTGVAADESRTIILTVKNKSGGSLSKGTLVHASPSATPPSGNVIEVVAAENDVEASMPALGVLNETLADEAEGECVVLGSISGISTTDDGTSSGTLFSVGDFLYVSDTAGLFTNVKPTGTKLIQKIGIVIKAHATNGTVEIFGAGRTNDVPTPLYIDHANQRVGIGETNPSFKLDINAGSNAGVFLTGSSDARYHVFSSSSANWVGYELRSSNANTFAGGIFRHNGDNDRVSLYNKTTEAISLKDGGNVGIGTTSPAYQLHVENTSANASIVARATANTNSAYLVTWNNHSDSGNNMQIRSYGQGESGTVLGNSISKANYIWSNGDSRMVIGTLGSTDLIFGTNNNERIRLLSSGTLLVGKTSSSISTAGIELNQNGVGNFTRDSVIAQFNRLTTDGDVIRILKDDSTVGVIGTQNWGIGTDSPSAKLHIKTTSENNTNQFLLESTDAGASSAPDLALYRNSASPADNDVLGALWFYGNNDASAQELYSGITSVASDVSDGTEDSEIRFLNMVNGTLDTRMTIDGTSVGIGTTSPARTLDVRGDAQILSTGATGLRIVGGAASEVYMIFGDADDNSMGGFGYDNDTNELSIDVNNQERIRIDSSGNVGIGTDSPQAALHVAGAFNSTSPTGNGVLMGYYLNAYGYIQLNGTSGGYIDFSTSGTDHKGRILYDNTYNYLRLDTDGAERMRLDSSGNFFVSKTSDSVATEGFQVMNDSYMANTVNNGTVAYFNRKTSDGSVIEIRKDNSAVGVIGTQNWGIGTTSPSSKLHVKYTGTGDGLTLESSDAGASASPDLVLYRNSSSPADADQIGNIFFRGKDDAGNDTNYALILGAINDASNNTEDGNLFFRTTAVGSLANRLSIVGDKIGIGTDSPSTKLYVDNGESTFNRGNSAGTIATFRGLNSAQAVIGTATSYFLSDVGIGTTSPTRELEVQGAGNVYIKVSASTDNDSSAIELENTQETWTIRNDDTNNDAFEIDSSTTGNIVTIQKTGNVGIGADSPQTALQILSQAGTNVYDAELSIIDTRALASNTGGGIKFGGVYTSTGTTNADFGFIRVLKDNATSGNYSYSMAFGTRTNGQSPAERMRITSGGSLQMAGTGTDNDSYAITFKNGACAIARDNNDLELHAYDNMVFGVSNTSYPTSTERMRIASDGKVGIGTTSPDSLLHIESTADTSTPIFTIENDNAIKMTLGVVRSAAGTSPDTSFVAYDGSLRFIPGSGSATEKLTLDSAGNATFGGGITISKSVGDSVLTIEADTDNNNENDNPRIELKQDSGIIYGHFGINGDANATFTGAGANSTYIRAAAGLDIATDGSTKALTIDNSQNATFAGRVKGTKFTSVENSTDGGFNVTRDYLLAGTGDRGGGLIISDISGARFAMYAGGYDLTFTKEKDDGAGNLSQDVWMRANAADAASNVASIDFLKESIFAGDVTVSGNLTVTGNTTSVNVEDLNVEQGEITLNYGTGDTSAAANGSGIRIQDAVDASNDATILWDQTNSEFDFSHGATFAGKIVATASGTDIHQLKNASTNGTVLQLITTGDNPDKTLHFQTDHIYTSDTALHIQNDNQKIFLRGSQTTVGTTTAQSGYELTVAHGPGRSIHASGIVKVPTVEFQHGLTSSTSVTSASTTTLVAGVSSTDYSSIFVEYLIKNGTNVRAGTVVAVHDGTNVEFNETSTVDLGDTSDVTLFADLASGAINVKATTTSSTWTIKSLIRAI